MEDPAQDLAEDGAFERLAEPCRREIQLHCYRMLGSIHDAEDAAQDTFLRAWRSREGFAGRSSFRRWLYRIATNVCLRALERRASAQRVLPDTRGEPVDFEPLGSSDPETAWLEPFPVAAVELIRDHSAEPAARYESHEAIQLAFVAAIHALPSRQRAILLLRDVLGFSSAETATVLDASVVSINSALQRARATVQQRYRGEARSSPPVPDEAQRRLLERYVRAWEAADVDGFVRLLADDAIWTMPPWRQWYVGRAAIAAFLRWVWRPERPVGSRLIPTSANGQPAFGYYRTFANSVGMQPFAIQVLTLSSDRVASIANFVDAGLLSAFGLPDDPGAVGSRSGGWI